MNQYRGLFIVVEGLDGTGKSTTEKVLQHDLAIHHKSIVLTHEPFMQYPNGKAYKQGQHMFKAIDSPNIKLSAQQTQKMFMQNGKEHMKQVIIPALKQGKTVICDRGLLSTLAYQGHYKNINNHIVEVNHILAKNKKIQGKFMVKPDLNVYLHLNDQDEIDRITGRAIGQTHKVDKFDKSLTQIKKLHYMRKQYHYALQDMNTKLDVPYKTIDARLQPEQRASKLSTFMHEARLTKDNHFLRQSAKKAKQISKSSYQRPNVFRKQSKKSYIKPISLDLLKNNKNHKNIQLLRNKQQFHR